MSDIQFEIIATATDLSSKSSKNWVKQLNLVKWGNREPVWDIRSWHYPENSTVPDKMSKGVSLSKEEMHALVAYINDEDFKKDIDSVINDKDFKKDTHTVKISIPY